MQSGVEKMRKFCWTVLVLAALALGVTSLAWSAEAENVFPFRISKEGVMFIRVRLADSLDAECILDTGAGVHSLSRSLFSRLPSRSLGRYTYFRTNGTRVDQELYEIPSIGMGENLLINPAVASWALLDTAKIDGIISAGLFEHRVVTLDFRTGRLIFEDSLGLRQRLKKGEIVPLKTDSDRGKRLNLFFDIQAGDNLVLECLLDTGAPATLESRFMPQLKVSKLNSWVGINEKGEKEFAYSGILEYLGLAFLPSVRQEKPSVGFMGKMIYDGQVGLQFLQGRVVTFNVPEKYAVFEK
jgi:predicted aspartyl protease